MARILESVRTAAVGERLLVVGESRAGVDYHAATVADLLPGGRARVEWADGTGYAVVDVMTLFREW
jgi:hypothetical protein